MKVRAGVKRCGPVRKRGLAKWKLRQIRSSRRNRDKKPKGGPLFYTVIKGTFVRVRKYNDAPWIDYVTKEEIAYHGYPDEDGTHYFLTHLGWRIKVRKNDVVVSRV